MMAHWDYLHSVAGRVNHVANPSGGTLCGKGDILMYRLQYRDDGGRPLCIKCEEVQAEADKAKSRNN